MRNLNKIKIYLVNLYSHCCYFLKAKLPYTIFTGRDEEEFEKISDFDIFLNSNIRSYMLYKYDKLTHALVVRALHSLRGLVIVLN